MQLERALGEVRWLRQQIQHQQARNCRTALVSGGAELPMLRPCGPNGPLEPLGRVEFGCLCRTRPRILGSGVPAALQRIASIALRLCATAEAVESVTASAALVQRIAWLHRSYMRHGAQLSPVACDLAWHRCLTGQVLSCKAHTRHRLLRRRRRTRRSARPREGGLRAA